MRGLGFQPVDWKSILKTRLDRDRLVALLVDKEMPLMIKQITISSIISCLHVAFLDQYDKMMKKKNKKYQSVIVSLSDLQVKSWINDRDDFTFDVVYNKKARTTKDTPFMLFVYVGCIANVRFIVEFNDHRIPKCIYPNCKKSPVFCVCHSCASNYCGIEHHDLHHTKEKCVAIHESLLFKVFDQVEHFDYNEFLRTSESVCK